MIARARVNRRMGLAGSMGAVSLWAMAVSASSPVTVLSGGIPTTYAATGVTAVGASFLVLGLALAPLTIGYVAACRHIGHAATTYALLAQGLGRIAGTAGAAVALVSYNAITVSLLGLMGFVAAGAFGGVWWLWAVLAWAVVATFGRFRITANALFLTVVVAMQVAVVAAVCWAGLSHPADGAISHGGLGPADLLAAGGAGGVFAFGLAAFIGFESATSYAEEAKSPGSVGRATLVALSTLATLYALAAWAMAIGVGPARIVDAARDPDGRLPFGFLGAAAGIGTLVLIVAILASLLSFHNLIARYLYALGRERALPAGLGQVGRGTAAGAPTRASLTQSVISLAIIVGVVLAHGDPLRTLFIPASTLAAIGVLSVLVWCSVAAGRFFARGGGANEHWLVRVGAPVSGTILGAAVLITMVANLDTLLGVGPSAPSVWALPSLVLLAAGVGVGWGLWLRRNRPTAYALIGQGRPRGLAKLDPRLVGLRV